MKRLGLFAFTACGVIATCTAAHAQAGSTEGSGGLEDIVVTAQKRAENLQDVPISVAALSAESLKTAGVSGLEGITNIAPGIVAVRGTGATNFYLRGIGTSTGAVAVESPVATFVDGVYQPSLAATTLALNNVERVEVLKGPQGTLYGRNATAGAVNIITRKPSFDPRMDVELSYGNLDTIGASLYATTGLSDAIAMDLAFYYANQRDGFGTNLFTGNDNNYRKDVAIRGKLLINASDALTVTLAADYSRNEGPFGASQRLYRNSIGVDGQPFSGGFWDTRSDVDTNVRNAFYGGSARVEYDFGGAVLTSITAYREVNNYLLGDLDLTPLPLFRYPLDETGKQFTQELQLTSGGSGPLQWVVGLFYLDGKGGFDPFHAEGLALAPATSITNFTIMSTKSYSGYGQGTYALSDTTNLTAGLRYTRDERSLHSENFVSFGGAPILVATIDDARDYEKLTWRFAIDHHFSNSVMSYASYSRGFKSGTYNTTAAGDPPVQPETLDAYEIGVKSTLFDRHLQLNASAFYYDYQDIQLTKIVGASQLLLNAAVAESYGIELEAEARVAEGLTVRGNVQWLHGRYKTFENAPVSVPLPTGGNSFVDCTANPAACNVSGNHMVAAPDWTAGGSIDYTTPLADGTLGIALNASYNDGFNFEPDERLRQRRYALLGGQIKWSGPDDRYHVRLFGSNLTNTKYLGFATATGFGDISQAALGRTYGVAVGYSF